MLLVCLYLLAGVVAALVELEDFPGCGRRNEPAFQGEDECLWDCTWITNPFYKDSWSIMVQDENLNTVFSNVTYIMTTPRIPENLACLDDCGLPTYLGRPDRNCSAPLNSYFDCYLNHRKRNMLGANTRTKDDCRIQEDGQLGAANTCQVSAKTPWDLRFDICYIALCFREHPKIQDIYNNTTCKSPFEDLENKNTCPPENQSKRGQKVNDKKQRKMELRRLKDKLRSEKRRGRALGGRVSGASTQHTQPETPLRYPWLCSLKSRGFRGRHLCSVTLLSAPPRPTILVSTAHCNYICKDGPSILEVCCCRPPQDPTSCRNTSSYCGGDPKVALADPTDLQIVCGTFNNGEIPELVTEIDEIVLNIHSFSNHPQYDATKGPVAGFDMAVYHVDDRPLAASGVVSRRTIWPICFPKKEYLKDVPGILAGWRDPRPSYYGYGDDEENANVFRLRNLETRQARMNQTAKCEDPAWMKIPSPGTFYPAGVVCARDPSGASCLQFGNSGSGLMRAYIGHPGGPYWYSWEGSLSMYKGCDQAITGLVATGSAFNAQRGDNPGIFSQASCYLTWIAEQYGMVLGSKLQEVAGKCSQETGTKVQGERDICRTNRATACDFTATYDIRISFRPLRSVTVKMDTCKLLGLEGYSGNTFFCVDTAGELAACANNCPGVDPNAIVVGGAALAIAATASLLGVLQPVIAIGGVGAAGLGVGGLNMMARASCSPPYCRTTRGQCCLLIMTTRGTRCPRSCVLPF